MSFANFDLESQSPLPKKKSQSLDPRNQSASQNELDTIIDNTAHQLKIFGSLVSQFDSQRKQIGSKRDSLELRNSIEELIKKISDMEIAIKQLVSNLSGLINKKSTDKDLGTRGNTLEITSRQIVIKERLLSEFNSLHSQFQKTVRAYMERKQGYPLRDASMVTRADEKSPLLTEYQKQGQEQLQVQMSEQTEDLIDETELQYQVLLTEEREREITQVTEAISDVNLIFKDLGQLINQQGEQLDTIEDNIMQLHGNTQQAGTELVKAHEYQKRKGKWSCIFLIALCIFVLIVVLAIIT